MSKSALLFWEALKGFLEIRIIIMFKNFTVSKLVAGVIGFTMVMGVAFTGTSVKAQTATELQAQIAALQAALAALSGTPATGVTCSFTFTQNLSAGATGAEVMNLQKFLNASADTQVAVSGVGSKGMESSYFGPATKAAVMKFQAKYASSVLTPAGLTAPTGFWGALSRAKANALCSAQVPPVVVPGTPGTPSTGGLEGTDGAINDVNEISSYNNEEVAEGQDDVKILGMEVETSNDGDIAIRSMRVAFDFGSATASDNLDDYIESVTIYQGSTKVGSADVEDFTEGTGNVFTKTVTLTNSIVRSDTTEKFYIAVDAVGNIDSGDLDADWTVDVDNIRFEDGSGVVTTEEMADLGDMDVPFDFVDFATAVDTEVKISLDSTSPEAGTVMIDEDSNTDVVLLKGKIRVEGDSDVTIDELPVTLTTSLTDVDFVTGSLTLKLGSEEFTETVNTATLASATITFDNLDFAISAGSTVSFTLTADVNDIDANLTEGATITASLTSTNRDYMDVENEENDQVLDSDKTGVATGEEQILRTSGISAALVSVDETVTTGQSANDDSVTFEIRYKVSAVGDDVYVASLAANALTYAIDRAGVATTDADISAVLVNTTDTSLTSVGNYLIEEGTTESFTLTISWAPGLNGLYRAALTGIKWDSADDITPATTYSSNLDTFKTGYVTLN